MYFCLRHAAHQVKKVAALKYGVFSAPLEERGDLQLTNTFGDTHHMFVGWNVGTCGNITHKVADTLTPRRMRVGGAVGAPDTFVKLIRVQGTRLVHGGASQRGFSSARGAWIRQAPPVLCQPQGHVKERGGVFCAQLMNAQGEPQRRRYTFNTVVVNSGVCEHHP